MGKKVMQRILFGVMEGAILLTGAFLSAGQAKPVIFVPQVDSSPPVGSVPIVQMPAGPELTRKQKDALLKDKYDKMKQDTAELVKLAQNLQKSVNSSSSEVLSVNVIKTSEKIEKLAKKIRENARGY